MVFNLQPFQRVEIPAFKDDAFVEPDGPVWVETDYFVVDIMTAGGNYILNAGHNQLQARAVPVTVIVKPFTIVVDPDSTIRVILQ